MLLAQFEYTFRSGSWISFEKHLESICTFNTITGEGHLFKVYINLFIRALCIMQCIMQCALLYALFINQYCINMEQKIQALVSHDWSACYLRWRSDQIYGIFSFVRTSSKDFSLNRCVLTCINLLCPSCKFKIQHCFPRPLDKVRGFTRVEDSPEKP